MSEEKSHWYAFSFSGSLIDNPHTSANASVYLGFPQKHITMPLIAEAKKRAGLGADAVLIAASYLGHVSTSDFNGDIK